MTQAENIVKQIEAMREKYSDDSADADYAGDAEGLDVEFQVFRNANIWWGVTDRYQPPTSDEDFFEDYDGAILYIYPDGSGLVGPDYYSEYAYEAISADEVTAMRKDIDADYAAELAEPLLAQSAGLGKA